MMAAVSAQTVSHGGVTDLVWNGSGAVDQVVFEQVNATTIRVHETVFNGVSVDNTQVFTGITGKVIGNGNNGNDLLNAQGLTTACRLDGGGGNNTLFGGNGGDVLIGGTNGAEGQQGSNTIVAGNGYNQIYGNSETGAEGQVGGNNLIVGGTGRDDIYGNWGSVPKDGGEGGHNLIIGGDNDGGSEIIYASQTADGAEGGQGSLIVSGTTDLSLSQLQAVHSEWASSRSLEERVANIQGTGTGPRNNGNVFLQNGVNVHTDFKLDFIYSESKGGSNWLFVGLADDFVSRVKSTDEVTNMT